MVVDISKIRYLEQVLTVEKNDAEKLTLGQKAKGNVVMTFSTKQTYFGSLGMLPVEVDNIILSVDEPNLFVEALLPKLMGSRDDHLCAQ